MWLSAPCRWCCGLQEAATQSAAVSQEAHRRSCWRGGASLETPRGTLAAMRAARTWRTVMTAWVVCEHCPPLLPSSASSLSRKTRVVFSPSWCSSIPSYQIQFSCSSGKTLLSSHSLLALFLFISSIFFKSYFPLFLHHWLKLFCGHFFCMFSAFWELTPHFFTNIIFKWNNTRFYVIVRIQS